MRNNEIIGNFKRFLIFRKIMHLRNGFLNISERENISAYLSQFLIHIATPFQHVFD